MKQEILRGKTQTLYLTPFINNRPAVPSSANITVTKPGGEKIVDNASATAIDSTTGEITYSFLDSANTVLGENFQAQWSYVVSGVTYYHTSLFDVVLNKIAITVVDDDLLDEQSDIMDRNESASGIVDSSGNTSLVDSELKAFPNDHWNGGKVSVVDGATGVEQQRTVTDFVQSTGTITIDGAWGTNPTTAYSYLVRRGFAHKIKAAFEEIMIDVRARGFRPALILESNELKIPLIKKTLALICRDFLKEPDDKWASLAKDYEDSYRDLFSKINFQYDRDESGYIGADFEKDQDLGSVRLRR